MRVMPLGWKSSDSMSSGWIILTILSGMWSLSKLNNESSSPFASLSIFLPGSQ